ncbi:Uncharacterised protein [Shigella sonnei]|nr:Uncharacterised protein [Shigella sonnei]
MKASSKRLFKEQFVKRTVRQLERHVHPRTVSFRHVIAVEIAVINHPI